jgi:hypothetical protein
MKARTIRMTVAVVAVLIVLAGAAGAMPGQDLPNANVGERINYQGRLTDPGGTPLTGTFPMQFQVSNASTGGILLWDSGLLNVSVDHGLFNVALNVNQADFDGQALWLRIYVNGEWLSPRQELVPVPYALSLRPGAHIKGEPSSDNWILGVDSVSTGTAVHGESPGGFGVVGRSTSTYGVWGQSTNSWGGYFTSSEGYGIRVNTNGDNHWDHAGYFTSNMGYGVYGVSTQNHGVRGEGAVAGVRGIGGATGVSGSSTNGDGVAGWSSDSTGVYGSSDSYHGVEGFTWRSDNNYGLFTYDNLYSLNIHTLGAEMQVARNGGEADLEPGDVVVFAGLASPLEKGAPPVIQVAQASSANSHAVAGVVQSRFNIETLLREHRQETKASGATVEVTPDGPVPAGEYLLLVTKGPAQVKASALPGAIQPGDLLSTAGESGYAAKTVEVTVEGLRMAVPGTVFGKALEALEEGQGLVYVFVTLH